MKSIRSIAAALLVSASATAAERLVPEQYPTLAAALGASEANDVVSIAPGTHAIGYVTMPSHAVVVRGRAGRGATILTGAGILVLPGSSASSIESLTIRAFTQYGAIEVRGSAIQLMDVEFDHCDHGVFMADGGAASTVDCVFRNGRRGGYAYTNAQWNATRCFFLGNDCTGAYGGGAAFHVGSGGSFNDCVFIGNHASSGGAIGLSFGGARTFNRCYFEANTSPAGPVWWTEFGASGTLSNSTLCGHSMGDLSGSWTNGGGNHFLPQGCEDCNRDGRGDKGQILVGELIDADADGIPDVCEWPPDCNGDGVVDALQCRSGELADVNCNNIPDCCEQGIPCVVGNYPVQWRAVDGGNGHWYALFRGTTSVSWNAARESAASRGGYLATVASAAENDLLFDVTGEFSSWANAYGPWLGGYLQGSAWRWVTDEPWTWTNWCPSEPNNRSCSSLPENALQFGCGSGRWNDFPAIPAGCDIDQNGLAVWGYLVEWSADCNSDGIVDYGQILSGQLRDTNANGIPDACERIVCVPQDQPTIQAAIAGIPAGQSWRVVVAPGTYSGPIDFGGKDVVVRGAGPGSTIIAGSGGQISAVVRFSGGEPSSAALEQFTIRGGLTGSPIPQAPQFLVGGGLFANESAARVRDCVFEDNFASYGGGAYLRNSSTAFERCTFRLNRSGSFGGGLQFLNSSAAMTDCVIVQNVGESRGGGLHVVNGTTVLTRVDVLNNVCTSIMGGISFDHAADPTASLQVVDCEVEGNRAFAAQGGIGVLAPAGTSRMSLAGSRVCGNVPRPNVAGPWQDLGGNTVCACAADLTGNDVVNGDDLGILLASWGACTGSECPADLTRDGHVNGDDLGYLLTRWGPCPG